MYYASRFCEQIDNGETITFTGPCKMPNLSADQREFLISGTSPEGWKILFGNDEK